MLMAKPYNAIYKAALVFFSEDHPAFTESMMS
jgi:hypothetical protein